MMAQGAWSGTAWEFCGGDAAPRLGEAQFSAWSQPGQFHLLDMWAYPKISVENYIQIADKRAE